MIGKTLGHYQISSQLGKGGMGEVYLAKDQNLGRDVAIKVLPEEFAKDANRVARFQREAKLLASLNHPNIAAIYGLEESGGSNFLVLELVEGETLADQIERGPILVEESLTLALQIADALEAAHEKGVVHRDLKPANIKVTPDGKVKVLDFGLAKAFAGEQADLNLSNSPTLSYLATMQGVILGPAAYMAPEQARGKPVGKRADIWAFGCVLFEMLTGSAVFSGNDVTDILAAVIRSDPDWDKVPARVRPLLRRCLQKDLDKRLRDIGDATLEMHEVLANANEVPVLPITAGEPLRRQQKPLLWLTAILAMSAITGMAGWSLRKPEPSQVTRLYDELPKGHQSYDPLEPILAISANGRQIAYSTSAGLYVRSLGELDSKLIAGASKESVMYPFFSPDGRWIGYWSPSDGQLKKVAVGGGAPIVVCNTSGSFGGASWDSDSSIVFSDLGGGGVMRVSADGGTPEYLVRRKPKWEFSGESFVYPQLLPGGKAVLFYKLIQRQDSTSARIMVQSLQSGESRELAEGHVARYFPTGHIVYMVGANILGMGGHDLFAVPFDLNRLEPSGVPVQVVKNILGPYGLHYAVSDSGTLLYIPGRTGALVTGRTLVWVDRKGNEESLAAPAKIYRDLRISPDESRVAMTVQETGGSTDIWVWDLNRRIQTRLTFEGLRNSIPIWTADSKRIAFRSGVRGANYEKAGIFWKAADGNGEEELLALSSQIGLTDFLPCCWSSDRKHLVGSARTQRDIGMMSLEGDHGLRPLLQEAYRENQPAISPDGLWMAYTSDESRMNEVYVRSFPDVNWEKTQVSNSGGDSPRWSRDGSELFYRNGDAVMAVAVKTKPSFNIVGTPQVLFKGNYVGLDWDVHPDAKRFLMLKPPETSGEDSAAQSPIRITIVLNWFEELKQAPKP